MYMLNYCLGHIHKQYSVSPTRNFNVHALSRGATKTTTPARCLSAHHTLHLTLLAPPAGGAIAICAPPPNLALGRRPGDPC